ncbi:transposase [Streptomyces sp. NPDC001389]|uniref:transposase n=1 Tax=Streptomyces sp. NPDC001389 TaxID=3364569 RepID=UPI00369EA215
MGRGDPTDDQRAAPEPLLPKGTRAGRPPVRSRRRLIDGIRLQVRTGVPRRDVPVEYVPWGRVRDLFRCAANTVMGVAVTAGSPSREAGWRVAWTVAFSGGPEV